MELKHRRQRLEAIPPTVLIVPFMELKPFLQRTRKMPSRVLIVPFMELKLIDVVTF